MPTPSKFSEVRRRVLIAAIGCGASRRTASKLAGIHHRTLARWLEFGAGAAPGGRWRRFFEAVQDAESNPRLAVFPDVEDEPDVAGAWRFLERTEFRPEAPEPVQVSVSFFDGAPISKGSIQPDRAELPT